MAGVLLRRLVGWGGLLAAQAALWLGFTGQVDKYEIIGASVGAIIATAAVGIVHWARLVHAVPRPGDIVKLWRVPWDVATGMWTICVAVCRKASRGEEGEVIVASYAPAGPGNRYGAQRDGARRMLMTTFVSVAPGSMFLGIVKHGRRVVVHQVLKGEGVPALVKSMAGEQKAGPA